MRFEKKTEQNSAVGKGGKKQSNFFALFLFTFVFLYQGCSECQKSCFNSLFFIFLLFPTFIFVSSQLYNTFFFVFLLCVGNKTEQKMLKCCPKFEFARFVLLPSGRKKKEEKKRKVKFLFS